MMRHMMKTLFISLLCGLWLLHVAALPNEDDLEEELRRAKRAGPSNLTAGGDRCRANHACGHHGYRYSWCYTGRWSWGYCCTDECNDYRNYYNWCHSGKTWVHCSPANGNTVTWRGTKCRPGHQCGHHGNIYMWCYTDRHGSWDYCCAGGHSCKAKSYWVW